MRRILLSGGLLLLCAAAASAQESAVGLIVVLRDNIPQTLDVSFPATASMDTIQYDLAQAGYWTGWHIQGEPAETKPDSVSVHAQIQGAAPVQSIISDIVWPLVGAMARHQRAAIVVMGAAVSAAPLVIENRFVRLEQSGGAGVQSYQAYIKDTSFRSLEELKRPQLPDSAGANGRRGASSPALRWFLVVLASLLTGVAVYVVVSVVTKRR